MTRIKFCGLTQLDDVRTALQLGVHALGFVFYHESKRFVSTERATELTAIVPPFVTTVGLFVNASLADVTNTVAKTRLNMLQFHGDETPEQCHDLAQAVQRPFLKAMRIQPGLDAKDLLEYELTYRRSSPWFSALLLDSFVDSYGGSGKAFDWSIIPKDLAPRVVLSGGLNAHNVGDAIHSVCPWAVDVSSGIEQSKGIKDVEKMRAFSDAVRRADADTLS
jgi:phosphoribosylanthranilate isomerase